MGVEAACAYGLLRCTKVMNSCVETHVRLHIHALLEFHHDTVHARLEISPCGERIVLVGHGGHRSRHGGWLVVPEALGVR
jgi:hypothetical protein